MSCILVVEDEDQLRDAICGALRRSGYTVYAAKNGIEALGFIQAQKVHLDLVVTDVVMPEMGGHGLVRSLINLGYKIKILFLSGFTAEVVGDPGIASAHAEFLEKPFGVRELLAKIQVMLGDLNGQEHSSDRR